MHTEPALSPAIGPEQPSAVVSDLRERRSGGRRLKSARLDARQLELLILNLDASLRVHTRAQFFVWSQELLQGLLPHRVLLCVLPGGDPMKFRADALSTVVPEAGAIGDLLLRDAAVVPSLIKAWKERQFQPLDRDVYGFAGLAGGAFARELARVAAGRLLLHGCHDAQGEVRGLYVLACAEPDPAVDECYLLQLCVPFLHAAWVRTQTAVARDGAQALAVGAGVLTVREREILRWIYLGKSNGEIGAILRISPMTVKNHVQKILRKLDVVNRAQAVGKALDAQIICR